MLELFVIFLMQQPLLFSKRLVLVVIELVIMAEVLLVVQRQFNFEQSKSYSNQHPNFVMKIATSVVSSLLLPGVLKPFKSMCFCFAFASLKMPLDSKLMPIHFHIDQ